MRSLSKTSVLLPAAVAALVTLMVCAPRLVLWSDRTDHLGILMTALGGTAWVMWSFLIGWLPEYGGQKWWKVEGWKPHVPIALAVVVLGNAVLALALDPHVRAWVPKDYPRDGISWVAMTGFSGSFEWLFLTAAPYAFAVRLSRHPGFASGFAIVFATFVLMLKVDQARDALAWSRVLVLILARVSFSVIQIWSLRRLGACGSILLTMSLQLRHLLFLQAGEP